MEEKLRSISRRIHWSSLLRAAVFSASWLFLPFWAFFLIALYLYSVPWFREGKLAVPFFALLLLANLEQPQSFAGSVFYAIVFGAVFYLILLVKDLLVLDRREFYEIIVLGLSFFFLRGFFAAFEGGVGGDALMGGGAALFYAFLVSMVIALLAGSFLRAFPEDNAVPADGGGPAGEGEGGVRRRRIKRTVSWLIFLLLFQLCVIGLFLPLDFVYQSGIAFLLAAFVIDLAGEYAIGGEAVRLTRERLAAISGAVFALLVIILVSAQWGL